MKKRIVSTILAAVTVFSTVSAFNTNATARITTQESIDEHFKDLTKVDDFMWLLSDYQKKYAEKDQSYIDYTDGNVLFYRATPRDDEITIELHDNECLTEFKQILKNIDENLKLSDTLLSSGIYLCTIQSSQIDFETVKKIRDAIGNNAMSFKFRYAYFNYTITYFYNITGYPEYIYEPVDDITNDEKLKEYIAKNNVNADTAIYFHGEKDAHDNTVMTDYEKVVYLCPADDITPLEHFKLAKNIYEETGLYPEGYSPDHVPYSICNNIDLTDYLNGDANCDRKYSIADSTAILQALGNPDKYGLSDLGLFNADSTGNGLTVEDAVAIKTALAKGL